MTEVFNFTLFCCNNTKALNFVHENFVTIWLKLRVWDRCLFWFCSVASALAHSSAVSDLTAQSLVNTQLWRLHEEEICKNCKNCKNCSGFWILIAIHSKCWNIWRKFPSILKATRFHSRSLGGIRTKIFFPVKFWSPWYKVKLVS